MSTAESPATRSRGVKDDELGGKSMGGWTALLLIAAGGLMVWMAIRTIKNNRESFSKENISKSFGTIAWLTLMIIVVVGFCVLMLRAG